MPLPHPAITQLPTLPKPAAVPSLWNTRYAEIDDNFDYIHQSLKDQKPPGEVCFFATTSAPNGFLKANGALISRAAYAELFAVIGVTFGVGDSVSTFSLPDLRGEFVRGWDDGRGIDPSRGFGSVQSGTRHGYAVGADGVGAIGAFWSDSLFGFDAANKEEAALIPNLTNGGPVYPAGTMYQNIQGSVEIFSYKSRPRNVALLACIKY